MPCRSEQRPDLPVVRLGYTFVTHQVSWVHRHEWEAASCALCIVHVYGLGDGWLGLDGLVLVCHFVVGLACLFLIFLVAGVCYLATRRSEGPLDGSTGDNSPGWKTSREQCREESRMEQNTPRYILGGSP